MSRNRCILFAVLALTLSLPACGGGGGGGGDGGGGGSAPQFTTLFEDSFDSLSGSKWTFAGQGNAVHDPARGFPAAGSLKIDGATVATARAGSFSADGGLQIYVRVHLPPNTVANPSQVTSGLMISIESTELGTGRAELGLFRQHCGGNYGTRFDYTITAGLGSGNTLQFEELGCASVPDARFIDFAFIVWPDGSSEWRRDNVTVLSFGEHFGTGGVRLKLSAGGNGTVVGLPGWSVWYDDVLVVKPN